MTVIRIADIPQPVAVRVAVCNTCHLIVAVPAGYEATPGTDCHCFVPQGTRYEWRKRRELVS